MEKELKIDGINDKNLQISTVWWVIFEGLLFFARVNNVYSCFSSFLGYFKTSQSEMCNYLAC